MNFFYLLPVFIDSQPMNTVTHFDKSSSLQGRSLYWVLCKSALVNFNEWRQKHRHATRAGGTFFSINPGCRSTQWTLLNSYDNVNDPTSLFGYGVQRKRKQVRNLFSLRKCDKVFFYQDWIVTIDQWLSIELNGTVPGKTAKHDVVCNSSRFLLTLHIFFSDLLYNKYQFNYNIVTQ